MSQRTGLRTSHTRRRKLPTQTGINNMAEARRQIAQALQLHRSSLLSKMATMSTVECSGWYGCEFESKPIFSDSRHFCYSILESMPAPQPTWSTTAPSVLRSPVPPVEEIEVFEWGDGQAGYAWWLGFLKALDVNSRKETEYSTAVMTQCQDGSESEEPLFLEASEHCSFADEWLIIPISEDSLSN